MKPTSISSLAVLMIKALQQAGIDPAPVFAEAGMDIAKHSDPDARYEYEAISKL